MVWEQPYGIGAVKGLSNDIKQKLADATANVWAIPEFKKDLNNLGLAVLDRDGPSYNEQLRQMQNDIAKVLDLLKK